MNRMLKTKVDVVKSIKVSYQYIDLITSKSFTSSKSFKTSERAAEYWAAGAIDRWKSKTFKEEEYGTRAYHRMTQSDYDNYNAHYAKYYRRALPIFKKLL